MGKYRLQQLIRNHENSRFRSASPELSMTIGTVGFRFGSSIPSFLGVPSLLLAACVAAGTLGAMPSSLLSKALGDDSVVPEPDPVPRRWQLDVATGPLRTRTLTLADGSVKSFAFMTYKVVNNTGQDLLFAPSFELSTDEGSLVRAGREVPAEATRTILASLQSLFIQDQISVVGPLLQGEENAREGLAVWVLPDVNVADMTVYATGFSGETRGIDVKDPATGELKRVLLRKTLMVRHLGPGEILPAASNEIPKAESRWILR